MSGRPWIVGELRIYGAGGEARCRRRRAAIQPNAGFQSYGSLRYLDQYRRPATTCGCGTGGDGSAAEGTLFLPGDVATGTGRWATGCSWRETRWKKRRRLDCLRGHSKYEAEEQQRNHAPRTTHRTHAQPLLTGRAQAPAYSPSAFFLPSALTLGPGRRRRSLCAAPSPASLLPLATPGAPRTPLDCDAALAVPR
ncbi:hypothetical protein BS50DRAFT_40139 [Corynespora cassiicola Philippines]|uniref:Uncharacterized protein n=1 Tax=Corynespora cassiicola Philippines TaxID=1448308 RepID=A0A2T2PD20_CORCC|nr:hypothetical protein BS50DRAFT_40139 [Corynespora cassiicola Philippines]